MGELYNELDLRTTPSFKPFFQSFLDTLMVGLRYIELFLIYRIFIFEVNFVIVVPGQPEVVFVQAEGILVLKQDVDVLLSVFVWDLEVATVCDFIPG